MEADIPPGCAGARWGAGTARGFGEAGLRNGWVRKVCGKNTGAERRPAP
jgi:hypothetical protein